MKPVSEETVSRSQWQVSVVYAEYDNSTSNLLDRGKVFNLSGFS